MQKQQILDFQKFSPSYGSRQPSLIHRSSGSGSQLTEQQSHFEYFFEGILLERMHLGALHLLKYKWEEKQQAHPT